MEGYGRPNRSDVHISKEDEAKIEGETREYFDGLAPKRHSKPQRSEYSLQYVDSLSNDRDSTDGGIPELTAFQRLEHDDNQKLDYKGGEASEEFIETEYYKDLNSIDKQHHTTGKGFIKTDNCNCFSLTPNPVAAIPCHPSCRGNPATNDWIPAATDDTVNFASSDKPNRSES